MTQNRARALNKWQAGNTTPKGFQLLSKKRISPKLIKTIFSTVSEETLCKILDNLFLNVDKEKERSISILNLAVNEKITPSYATRNHTIQLLRELAAKGEERVLPGLLEGFKDSNKENRAWAADGLALLIRRNPKINQKVIEGLDRLAREGVPNATQILKNVFGYKL